MRDGLIQAAVADPFDTSAADDVRMATGRSVELVYANPRDIRRLVEEFYVRRMMADTAEEVQIVEESVDEIRDLERRAR